MPLAKMPVILSENDLLDQGTRKKVIEALRSEKNLKRKAEAYKAYDCLKDKTVDYVLDLLLKQFEISTVLEMQYALTNISVLRKVIEKLAKVYANGVKRSMPKNPADKPAPKKKPLGKIVQVPHPDGVLDPATNQPLMVDRFLVDPQDEDTLADESVQPDADVGEPEDPDTQAIEEMALYLKLDTAMKKCNRYFRTFKNTLVYPKPIPNDDVPGKFDLRVDVLPPFHYDVIENRTNPEKPLAVILSDYEPKMRSLYALGDAAVAGRTAGHVREIEMPVPDMGNAGETRDQGTADDNRTYIWWTKSFHFTTNSKGEILKLADTDEGKNPIGELPFVNVCGEQDGEFWAEGGHDLVDAGIKINIQITNMNHIAISQGHGQLYMTGKNLPKSVKVGPNHCVQLQQEDKDEPVPQIGYLNANPQIGELRSNVEMMMALMLSTNNLSTHGFSTSLSGGKDFASGIAMILDKSESLEDIGEQSKIFIEKEPQVWRLLKKWFDVYASAGVLSEELSKIKLPDDPSKVQLAFPEPKPLISEMDSLAIIQKRRDLGMNTMVELMMRDNPSLTEQEAQEKIDKIVAEKAANAAKFGLPSGEGRDGLELYSGGGAGAPTDKPAPGGAQGGVNGNQSQASGGKLKGNGVNDKPNGRAQAPGQSKNPHQE